ncbi:MAG: TetR/AcrR family transcriptional regulator C-terminal domain-containing protein, partial [bacterium]|nr:TetR/AcrR family transcriptional regulator C-terminal domain-containing protein [bacterium]
MSVGNRLRGLVGLGAEGREQVVGAALDVLDEAGLDGLTMRTLAERMGVRAASLYWHIRDKDQLLGLVAEAILAEVPEPPADLPWRAQLETFATGYRRVLHAHRDAARIVLEVQPAAPGLYERLVATLLAAGFEGGDAVDACHLIAGTFVPAAVAEERVTGPAPDADRGELRAPLGGADRGRLVLTGGAAAMTLRSDPGLGDLYAGRFGGRLPAVEVQGGTVRIVMRHRRVALRADSSEVTLNAAIPWDVEIGGGAWRVHADLRGLRLGSLAVSGGVATVTLVLPAPTGVVPVRLRGGVHKVAVHRPAGSAARVRIESGAAKLRLDTMHLGAVGGEVRWETPGLEGAPDRYDLEVGGGANELTLGTGQEAGVGDSGVGESAPGSGGTEGAPGGWAEPLSADEFPTLAPFATRLTAPDPDARFEFGLRVLLDGLERG